MGDRLKYAFILIARAQFVQAETEQTADNLILADLECFLQIDCKRPGTDPTRVALNG